jgi:OFA family oxalate/formate antiporter-like MFS transporter
MSTPAKPERLDRSNKGWAVTFAGSGVNLALGVLYSWGVFAAALRAGGWSATQSQIPYMIACAVFAIIMVPAGRLQDRIGPRQVILTAAILTGVGFVGSSMLMTVFGLSVFFGVIFGTAMGFGYAAATPAAIKWFSPQRRGLISGIVVSGFGLAGIYIAPLTTFLIAQVGLASALLILGLVFCLTILLCSRIISNPPPGYQPPQPEQTRISKTTGSGRDFSWREMLRTRQFYLLWLIFCLGTFAGLKVLGQLSNIAQEQVGMTPSQAASFVMIYAVFNWLGRVTCGVISDKIGRKATLVGIFLIQVLAFAFFAHLTVTATLALGTILVAFSFGGMLTCFPAIAADYYGIKNLGINYGLIFTAWGGGGVFGPLLGGIVRDLTGTYQVSYTISAILCLIGAGLSLLTHAPAVRQAPGDSKPV